MHKIVIGRTLGGRVTIKALNDCLKLHLLTSFISTTLLTKGYFEILFENEDGAKATRKLTTVKWSGLNLSFSKYMLNFDANSQGAETLLTHTIKVQFPNLHKQFRNTKVLTIMASKLGEVFEIEATDSYIKRLAYPMIIIEVRDITKLAGFIKIPSMAESILAKNIVAQRILYSDLSNQCQKCRRFGHHTRACNVIKTKTWEGNAPPNNPPLQSKKVARASTNNVSHHNPTYVSRAGSLPKAKNNPSNMGGGTSRTEARAQVDHPSGLSQTIHSSKLIEKSTKAGADERSLLGDTQMDQDMAELSASLRHLQDRPCLVDKRPPGRREHTKSKIKL